MLNIGSKVYRNLPEQVAENIKQIAKIWEVLDGLDVYDNVVILASLDPLTPEELDILSKPVSFIVYNNNLYMKRGVSGSNVLFDKVFQVSESAGVITFDASELSVLYPLGTITANSINVSTYTKDQLDTFIGAKADSSDVYTKSEVLNLCYPVGSIYFSTIDTSPASTYGGTWTKIIDAKKLVSSGKAVVATRAQERIATGDTPMKFRFVGNGTEAPAGFLGLYSNGELQHTSGSPSYNGGLYPTNLIAGVDDLEINTTIYAWERIA